MPEHYRNARGSSPNDRDPFQIAIPYVHARTALERKPAGAQGTSVARRHVAFIVSVHEFQTAAGADTPTLSEARGMSHRAVSKLCQNPICLGRLGLMAERKQSPQVVNKRHIHMNAWRVWRRRLFFVSSRSHVPQQGGSRKNQTVSGKIDLGSTPAKFGPRANPFASA